MTTSPHQPSPGSDGAAKAESDLLVQDPPATAHIPAPSLDRRGSGVGDKDPGDCQTDEALERSTSYDSPPHEGLGATATEYSTHPGMPGRGVIVTSLAASAMCVGLDFALTGGLSMFFDLCFVVICLIGAMSVRRHDLFTTGVLAPLAFGAVVAVVAIVSPTTFAPFGGFGTVFPTGLAAHAGALVAGYGVALATVGGRVSAAHPR